jgi:hypothetical protein
VILAARIFKEEFKMKNLIRISAFIFVVTTAQGVLAEETQFAAFGGVGYSSVDVNNNGTGRADRDPGAAFGASLETPIGSTTGIEIGVIRQPDILQIPLLFRYGASQMITLAAGVDATTATGNGKRDFAFGYDLCAGLNFPFGDQVRGFVEGRYLQDFAKTSDESGLLAIAGLRVSIQ